MSQTIIVTIYSLLAIVGMVLVIMWGMSAAGSRHEGTGEDTSEDMHSREIFPEKPFLIDGANGESAVCTPGYVGEKPSSACSD